MVGFALQRATTRAATPASRSSTWASTSARCLAPLVCGLLGQKHQLASRLRRRRLRNADRPDRNTSSGANICRSRRHARTRERRRRERAALTPLRLETRIGAICVLFVFALIFWSVFEQAGSSLTLFADHHTRLSILGWTFPSSWFQSEQPLFVIMLAPVFAWLWVASANASRRARRNSRSACCWSALGFLLIIPAARVAETQHTRVSPIWLTPLYFVHTFGELCLSPVGLSLVTKLSPKRVVGLMMGFWFLGSSLGNFFAGAAAGLLDVVPFYQLFLGVAIVTVAASIAALPPPRPAATSHRDTGSGRRGGALSSVSKNNFSVPLCASVSLW